MRRGGVRYSYDRAKYSYDRQAGRDGWDDLERAAKRTMSKVSAMFKRSEDPEGRWEWKEVHESNGLWTWEIEHSMLHNVDMGHGHYLDLPEVGIDTESSTKPTKFFPVFFDVEWRGLNKPKGPWSHRGAIVDATPDFPTDVPLTDEKFRQGMKLLDHLERAVVTTIDRMEDKLADTFDQLEDDIRSFGRDDSY